MVNPRRHNVDNPADYTDGGNNVEKEKPETIVITQNIDDLHEQAGMPRVYKLHGDLKRFRCLHCGRRTRVTELEIQTVLDRLRHLKPSRILFLKQLKQVIPACSQCGGLRRPDIVFFGESLPSEDFQKAQMEAMTCQVMLSIGTSVLVYPAAEIPLMAAKSGATVVEINPEPTPLTPTADFFIQERSGIALTRILQCLDQ